MGANKISRLKSILNSGDFKSDVSTSAKTALKDSIKLRKKYIKSHFSKKDTVYNISLDFSKVNEVSIQKRGNLKVYENLPKGIRVVAR